MSGLGWIVLTTAVIGAFAIGYVAARLSARPSSDSNAVAGDVPAAPSARVPSVPAPAASGLALADQLVAVMESAAIVIDSGDQVLLANPRAKEMGLVRESRIVVRALLEISREVRRDGALTVDLRLPAGAVPASREVIVNVQGDSLDASGIVALVMHDVTEAHRVEAVRRDFVANVSHELKTPVGAISLLGEAIEDASDDEEAVRRFAASMQRESKRLATLVAELIELSRLQGAEPTPPQTTVDIAEVIAECVDGVRSAASAKNITIVKAGDMAVSVPAVRVQLRAAVSNLLTNAISYSPDNTKVGITYRALDGYVEIVVKDQGIGIAAGDIGRIFERFYRVDPARSRYTGGTGLGLAIVKHIATNHGGSVEVWSSEGDGSTFTLRLPLEPIVPAYGGPAGQLSADGPSLSSRIGRAATRSTLEYL